jgi:uncharacterized protein YciI
VSAAAREQCWIIRGVEVQPPPANADFERIRELHHRFIDELDDDGILVAHGATRDENGARSGTGLIVIRAATRAEALTIAAREPYVAHGVRTLDLIPWQMQRGRKG